MRRQEFDTSPRFTRGNGTPPPPAMPEDEAPKTVRERLAKLRGSARSIFTILPRAFTLVWSAHRGLTVVLGLLAVVSGIIPTATAWVSKLLVDAVVRAAGGAAPVPTTTPTGASVTHVVWLVMLQLALYLA